MSLCLAPGHSVRIVSAPSAVPGGVAGGTAKFVGGMRLGLRYNMPPAPTLPTVKCLALVSSSAAASIRLGTLMISLLSFAVRIFPEYGRIGWSRSGFRMARIGGFAGEGTSFLRLRDSALRSMTRHEVHPLAL